jgi:HSP90 family molecular chaperone
MYFIYYIVYMKNKRKHFIIILWILLFLILCFLVMNKNSFIIRELLFQNWTIDNPWEQRIIKILEKDLKFSDIVHLSTITHKNIYDARYVATNSNEQKVNVFVKFEVSLLKTSVKQVVIEKNLLDNPEWLANLEGEYEVLLWEWYEWTSSIVVWP